MTSIQKHVMFTSHGRRITCTDAVGWTNGMDFDCRTRASLGSLHPKPQHEYQLNVGGRYQEQRLCEWGAVAKHAKWASGEANNFPEKACCACGRWRLTSSKEHHSDARRAPREPTHGEPRHTAPVLVNVSIEERQPDAEQDACWSTRSPAIPWGGAPFCPSWPKYRELNGSELPPSKAALLRAAVTRALAPFEVEGVTRSKYAPPHKARGAPRAEAALADHACAIARRCQ